MLKLATKFAPEPAAFEQAHRAGFRCAELWLNAAVVARGQEVAQLARHYPFEYVLHFPNQLNLEDESLRQTVDLYQALGCRAMVIHQPHVDRFGERLLRLEPNLRLAVENHKLSLEDFWDHGQKNQYLTLDVEHVWKYTLKDPPLENLLETLRTFLARFAGKLWHVHMPGYFPKQEEHRPMYCSRDMVFSVLALLDEVNFDGLIVSEIEAEFQNPYELRMDVLLFETWRTRHERGPGSTK